MAQLLAEFVAVPSEHFLPHLPEDAFKVNHRSGVRSPRATQFIVVECAEQTLDRFLQDQGSSVSDANILNLGKQLAAALLFLQQQRVVHRDLKLDNLLLQGSVLQVCDFGLAIELDAQGRAKAVTGDLTRAGGNPSHLSPEVLNVFAAEQKQGRRQPALGVDYSKQPSWALGVLLYEIAAGEHPFDGYPIGHGMAPNLRLATPVNLEPLASLPPKFCELVKALLAEEPGRRPTLQEAHATLFLFSSSATFLDALSLKKEIHVQRPETQ